VVTFAPAPGASVVLDGELRTRGQNHIEVRGLTLGDFYLLRSSDITFRDVTMKFFFIRSSDHVRILGGSVGGIQDGISPTIGNYDAGDPPSSAILIDGVLFHDIGRANSPQSHIECLFVQETSGIVIRNSRFTRCDVMDVYFNDISGGPVPNGVTLENNWFDEPSGGGYAIDVRWDPGDVIRNYVVRYNSFNATALFYDNGVYENVDVYGNVGRISGCEPGIQFAYNVWSNTACAPTDRRAPAGFVDPEGFDLHLAPGSRALGAGDPTRTPTLDIDRDARPRRMAPDAGADQRESALIVPGRSLGEVRLGTSREQVEAVYGRGRVTRGSGSARELTLISYRLHGGRLWVAFAGTRAVGAGTTSPYYSTPEGLGVGVQVPNGLRKATYDTCAKAFTRKVGGNVLLVGAKQAGGKVASVAMLPKRYAGC
jgi:hypothetical protein